MTESIEGDYVTEIIRAMVGYELAQPTVHCFWSDSEVIYLTNEITAGAFCVSIDVGAYIKERLGFSLDEFIVKNILREYKIFNSSILDVCQVKYNQHC